ncbi:hypothetical protein JTE90_025862 [Oedothorax gibbosus]|uniref:Uncharacterized protein n=1 Tax=Oedothorax gibbosus TaxID=931172 RepID=A0AAV6UM33_9ARAC|nr:hypothetical protein JTE90_025862 [Oedothorax gibbosus]
MTQYLRVWSAVMTWCIFTSSETTTCTFVEAVNTRMGNYSLMIESMKTYGEEMSWRITPEETVSCENM